MQCGIRIVAFLALLASGGKPAFSECKLHTLLELQVDMRGLQPTVQATVEGQNVTLLVDTGADFNSLSPTLSAKLKLQPAKTNEKFYAEGVGGSSSTKFMIAKNFELAGQSFHNVAFATLNSGEEDGSLAQKFLRLADVEFDLLNGVIRFMRPEDCGDVPLAYWRGAQDLGVIDIESTNSSQPYLIGKALINGYHTRALFDTGSIESILDMHSASGAGVLPTTPNVFPGGFVGGAGPGAVPTWIAPIKEFRLGGETIRNTKLRIGGTTTRSSMFIPGDAEMILGADFFLSHRLYVSYQRNKIYFTYNGGPVFNLTSNPNQRVDSAADLSQPLPKSGIPSQDAAQYARKAWAFEARHQYDRAGAEFEAAMKLAPKDAEYAYDAGKARVFDKHPQEALADLDLAIALKPDFVNALIQRGRLLLHRREFDRGRADMDSAIAHSTESELAIKIALDYVDVAQYGVAVEMLSTWISKNPEHKSMPAAFSNRCYARAAGNEQLDSALSDCNTALAAMPGNHIALTRRALVYLRRGQIDRAASDFNEALKRQPAYGMALYGRGIVELRKGRNNEADRDFKAATGNFPEVSEVFAVMGLAPQVRESEKSNSS